MSCANTTGSHLRGLLQQPPVAGKLPGLYVHIPFCRTKCPYCDFYSVTKSSLELRKRLVHALLDELSIYLEKRPDFWRAFDSLYLGGGTPSLLGPDLLRYLLQGLGSRIEQGDARLREVTCEVNPADVTRELLSALADGGITRISLGIQSFQDNELRLLGRRHDAAAAARSIDAIQSFHGWMQPPDLCLDLIHDLPGSTVRTWRKNIEEALRYHPDHLSCYALTIADETPFGRLLETGSLTMPSEESRTAQYFLTHEILADQAGFDHYEVSNYARTPAHRAVHNVKYWTGAPYLGIGPAAHSFDGSSRWWNPSDVSGYILAVDRVRDQGPGATEFLQAGFEPIGTREAAIEALGLGLRWVGGLSEDMACQAFGPGAVEMLRNFVNEGLLSYREGRFVPTSQGLAMADGMAASVLAAQDD